MATKKDIPGPKGLPILGVYPQFRRNPLSFLQETASQYGPMSRFNLAGFEFILISDAEDIARVYRQDNDTFGKSKAAKRLTPLLGNGLLLSEGEYWQRQRRLAAPHFHRRELSGIIPIIASMTRDYLNSQAVDGETDELMIPVRHTLADLTLHILSRFFLTGDEHEAPTNIHATVRAVVDQFGERSLKGIVSPLWVPTKKNRWIRKQITTLDQFTNQMIKSVQRKSNPDANLMTKFVHSQDESGQGMTLTQIRDEIMTFMLAGHETTSNAISWTLYLLNRHPDVYQKLCQELTEQLADRPIAFSDLPSLRYLSMVIEESLRLYPPAWANRRTVLKTVEIGGYQLEKGTMVMVSQWATHRSSKYWQDPDRFWPERMQAGLKKERPQFSYFPFGGGKRTCIGSNFAMLEAMTILATIFQSFDLIPNPGLKTSPMAGVTVYPKDEINLKLKRRK
ncbi:cytochrome P450 [Pseudobacteriovorax antillogorgiicola]|uniref:Cytochrome P450 n=1 Tax=Pseudobacteriovorax antillogorgiicola TaxID=1513793 RepID=A0A1Y6CTT7_9BACT|nr:cytochrome P450 [Pseudobacteriovorax antillogorgiicola]TCS45417.1 cytochrome P450 [Pseudobacteriovorax antillogorgiicola]SMF74083.1 Cytochrome P450 [Pseudobacteriovorax antillogorgiicola]